MEATYFVHKQGQNRTKGVPISAILQCRKPLNNNEKCYLYDNIDTGEFYLREIEEFTERFVRVVPPPSAKQDPYWKHNTRGGRYRVLDTFMYVGNCMGESNLDGYEMKAYFMEHSKADGLFCPAKQFDREFEPRYVVKWYPDEKTKKELLEKQFVPPKGIVKVPSHGDIRETETGYEVYSHDKWTHYKYKSSHILTKDSFVTVYREEPFHNALVSRNGYKDVRVRGDNLTEVMKAVDALLASKVN